MRKFFLQLQASENGKRLQWRELLRFFVIQTVYVLCNINLPRFPQMGGFICHSQEELVTLTA